MMKKVTEIYFACFFFCERIVSFFNVACLHMACVISQKDTKHWFAELNVDLDKVRHPRHLVARSAVYHCLPRSLILSGHVQS